MEKTDASFFETIKNKGFTNLWINQILVQLSYNALNFALILWVFHLTNSNFAVSLLLVATYFPPIIFGLFAGILTDLTDRKKMIMWINLLLAICFFLLIPFKESFAAILILTFIINSLAQFYAPAESSAIPLIVPKEQLLVANSLFSITLFGSFLVGFGVAGPLMNLLGIDYTLAVGGVALVMAFLLTFLFPSIRNKNDVEGLKLAKAIQKRDVQQITKFAKQEIRDTLDLIRGKLTVLTALLILASVQVAIGIFAVIIPAFTEHELHIQAVDISQIIFIPLGVGMVLGGILVGRFGRSYAKRTIISRAILTAGTLLFGLGISPLIAPFIQHFPRQMPRPYFDQGPISAIIAIGSFLLGLAMVCIVVPSQTILQQSTSETMRGKIYAVLGVLNAAFTIIPVVLVGALADFVGTLPIFLLMGSITILLGVFAIRPQFYFEKSALPKRVLEFLGLGHWQR